MTTATFVRSLLLIAAAGLSISCSIASTEVQSSTVHSASKTAPEIERAESLISSSPDSPIGYRSLAVAHIRLGRETGDLGHTANAEKAVRRGLEKAPGDASLRKLQAAILLSDHRFREALAIGMALESELPGDPFVLGVLTDANAELGDYPRSAEYAQKMVDRRPDSSSYARAAHIRSLHGDHPGAVEMYKLAARTADPADNEARAWCLAQLGNEYWRNGNFGESLASFRESLSVLAGYHHALFGLGRTLASLGRFEESAAVLEDVRTRVPSIDTVLLLGDVYRRLGNSPKAAEIYAIAEAGEEMLGAHYDEHRMALFWADQNQKLDQALEIAIADHAEIKDIYASDILAWCYYKKGMYKEAKASIAEALRINTRDARLYFHAGMIEHRLGNRSTAEKHLKTALSINPQFDLFKADEARAMLEQF